jgi:hypothetical protein
MVQALQSTTNYDLFELHDLNRDVEKTDRLKQSMMRHGYIKAYPLHVVKNGSGKLKVKAGHHRLAMAKKLGIPVYYVVSDDKATIQELENATNPWTMKDYLASYVRQGKPEYISVYKYVEETGISLGNAISLIAGEEAMSRNRVDQFRNGNFKAGDPGHAMTVKDIVVFMKLKGVDFASNTLFVGALSKALWVQEFDSKRFKQKIAAHKAIFEKQPDINSYLDVIEAVYNRQSRDKLPVAFLAKERAMMRKETFGKAGR